MVYVAYRAYIYVWFCSFKFYFCRHFIIPFFEIFKVKYLLAMVAVIGVEPMTSRV
jgi:hypothetical protein